MSRGRRLPSLALALALIAPTGCASLAGLRSEPAPRLVRPDAPPDFDYLVARDLEARGDLEGAYDAYGRAVAKDPSGAPLWRKRAELAARQGRYGEALEQAQRAYDLDPGDPNTRLFLGTLHRLRKDAPSAELVLRGANGQPVDVDAALLLFSIYVDADRLPEAQQMAEWIIAQDPDGLRGYFALAGVQERMQRPADAERTLRRALARQPGNLTVYGALARGRRDRGDRDGEIAIYREVLRKNPGQHATLVALADALVAQNRTDEAIRTLEEVERRHPEDLRSQVRLGFLEYEAKRYDLAADRFERLLAANPDQPEVAYFLGLVRKKQDRDADAIAAFERVPEDHERWAEARAQIAGVYEQRKDYASALAELDRARAKRPNRGLDYYAASLRAKSGDFAGAEAFLKGLLAENPDDAETLYNLGVLYGEAKRRDDAERTIQLALEKDPDHAGALNYLGYSWAEQGENLDQAEALIRRALAAKPDDGFITDSLGWVFYMRAKAALDAGHAADGRRWLDQSLDQLRRADRLSGGDPVISEHLGDAYLLKGDRRRALEEYRRAVAQEPREGEQPDLPAKLDRLQRELGAR